MRDAFGRLTVRPTTTLNLRAAGALAELFARNRAEFGGFRMDATPTSTGYLERLQTQAEGHLAEIAKIERAAVESDRELTDEEIALVCQFQEALKNLEPAIERWTSLREAQSTAAQRSAATVPAPPVLPRVQVVEPPAGGATGDEPVFRSAGEAAAAMIRARRGDHAAEEMVQRAIAHQKTSDTPGLLPIPTIGNLLGTLESQRRIVPTATRLPLPPAGMEMKRPRIIQHTVVGKQGGDSAATKEKTDLPSQALKVDFDTYRLNTFGGAVNISIQDVERTDPGALELTYASLAQQYGIATEAEAAAVLVAGAKTATTLAAGAPLADLWKAVFTGAGTILEASKGRLPDVIYASVDQWARIGGQSTPINAQNGTASAVPSELSAVVGNLDVVVSPALPAGTLILGRKSALEYVEDARSPIRLSVPEPRILGYEIGVYGYFAAWVADPGSFTVLRPA